MKISFAPFLSIGIISLIKNWMRYFVLLDGGIMAVGIGSKDDNLINGAAAEMARRSREKDIQQANSGQTLARAEEAEKGENNQSIKKEIVTPKPLDMKTLEAYTANWGKIANSDAAVQEAGSISKHVSELEAGQVLSQANLLPQQVLALLG